MPLVQSVLPPIRPEQLVRSLRLHARPVQLSHDEGEPQNVPVLPHEKMLCNWHGEALGDDGRREEGVREGEERKEIEQNVRSAD